LEIVMEKCPIEVIKAGAALLDAARTGDVLEHKIKIAIDRVREARITLGARRMEIGEAEQRLFASAQAGPLVRAAHDDLRKRLALYGCPEPTDEQLKAILGGGGGGR
jgi:hypothetical protein